MEGIEHLKHGDLTKIAGLFKVSASFVSQISRGERTNPNIELAIKNQIEVRKKELNLILEIINES